MLIDDFGFGCVLDVDIGVSTPQVDIGKVRSVLVNGWSKMMCQRRLDGCSYLGWRLIGIAGRRHGWRMVGQEKYCSWLRDGRDEVVDLPGQNGWMDLLLVVQGG